MRLQPSKVTFSALLLVQLMFGVTVVALALLAHFDWLTVGFTTVLVANVCYVSNRSSESSWPLAIGWVCTLAAWGSLLYGDGQVFDLNSHDLVVTGMVALPVLICATWLDPNVLRFHWKLMGMTWAGASAFIWLVTAYLMNFGREFYLGVLANLALLILSKFLFKLPMLPVQVVNTFILCLVGLPIAEAFVRPHYYFDALPTAKQHFYSYEAAKKDPAAFARWWRRFVEENTVMQADIGWADTNGVLPYVLRPNSRGKLFDSRFSINSLGFRGPEIPQDKSNSYRIVALGESTTFGLTIKADDKPWPELLAGIIKDHLRSSRRVEVINAGLPMFTLRDNLARLNNQILPLKPDMIISYHGFNGFEWLVPSLPPIRGAAPPPYEQRPMKLLADAEYAIKMIYYKYNRSSNVPSAEVPLANPMDSEYARAYAELIEVARTNNIQLVLANYSMAVNSQSGAGVREFYRAGFPDVNSDIRANKMHTDIIEYLARRHSAICYVDTHPSLDGQHDKFIDLIHFTQTGRERIAATIFNSIQPLLERDVGVAK